MKRKKLNSPMYRLTGVPQGLWNRVKSEAAAGGETISDFIVKIIDHHFMVKDSLVQKKK